MSIDTIALGLFDSLWLGALLWIASLATLGALARTNAATRFGVWLTALVALPPVAAGAAFVQQRQFLASANAGRVSVERVEGVKAASALAASVLAAARDGMHVALPAWALGVVLAVWLIGSAWFLLRIAVDLRRLARLAARMRTFDLAACAGVAALAYARDGAPHVRFGWSDEIDGPLAVGFRMSVVLAPQRWVDDTISRDDIDRVVVHEIAHLRRHDDWWNLVQHVVCAALFFNPFVWLIARGLEVEREVACDDAVLRVFPDPVPYAHFLTSLARRFARRNGFSAAPGIFRTRRMLAVRVERAMGERRDIGEMPRVARLAGACAFSALVLFGGIAFAAPLSLSIVPRQQTAFGADARARLWLQQIERGDVDGLPLGPEPARTERRRELQALSLGMRELGPMLSMTPTGVTHEKAATLYRYRLVFRTRRLAYTYGENRSGGASAIVLNDDP